ncbi:hypothetical protein RRG08_040655 [Elysia crispata]|uniref:Uncharacterized protein n=1 Tax=Elysia crispata TaxID=231223 RepID=A0AAE0YZ03_9GAST|nr:hypothetical protein RRG08_040655 [Elysia crispata]
MIEVLSTISGQMVQVLSTVWVTDHSLGRWFRYCLQYGQMVEVQSTVWMDGSVLSTVWADGSGDEYKVLEQVTESQ